MQTIAELAGVSQGAVSLALSGKPGVSPATRERVQAVARELGYRPDPRLASLSERRWHGRKRSGAERIAALVGKQVATTHGAMVEAARQRAKEHGYGLETFEIDPAMRQPDFERILLARGIRGAMVMEGTFHQELRGWTPDQLAVVNCDIFDRNRPFHGVVPDYIQASLRICQLVEGGSFRRVVFATFADKKTLIDTLRRAAIGQARERLGTRCPKNPVFTLEDADDSAPFLDWMKKNRPDLLVAVNDYFPWQLRGAEWNLPEDCAVISLQMAPENDWITGFKRNDQAIGQRAVEMLSSALARLEFGPPCARELVHVASHWQKGTTLAGFDVQTGCVH